MTEIEIASYNPTGSNRKNFIASTAHYDTVFYSVSYKDTASSSESILIFQIKTYTLDLILLKMMEIWQRKNKGNFSLWR